LIDVLVVLLIFYIATTVFKKSQPNLTLKLAVSAEARTTPDTPPAILYISANDKIFLDNLPVDPDQLGNLLKSKIAADPHYKVALKPDTRMTFGTLTKVMDAVHDAGIADLPTFTVTPSH